MVDMLKIGDFVLKSPTEVEHQQFNLTKSGRVASGLMTMDIIAQKHKFLCKYDYITGPEFNAIMSKVFTFTPFYTLSVLEDNVWTDYTVYTGDITKKLHRTGNIWYYKDFSIDFIQQ